MKTLLDDFGFYCEIVADGKLAIEKLGTTQFDIILMDLQMPEMNGFEATTHIRNKMNLLTPIIALTADVTTMDLAKCIAIGMDDYLAKPIDEKLLYSKIVGLVEKSIPSSVIKADAMILEKGKLTNLDYLNKRTKSNPKLMMEMISLYLLQTPPLIASMKQSILEENWDILHATVHKMIPSFSIMGIHTDFELMAKKLQDFANAKKLDEEIHHLANQLEIACCKACLELEEVLQTFKNKTA